MKDRDISRSLEDLNVVVVERRQIRVGEALRDAPLEVAPVGVGIGPASALAGQRGTARETLLDFWSQRRDSPVRRIDDERRALVVQDLAAGIRPVLRVHGRGRHRLVGRFVQALRGAGFELIDFLLGQVLPARHVLRAFERRDGLVVPDALKIRIAPRSARRSPIVFSRRGYRALAGHAADGRADVLPHRHHRIHIEVGEPAGGHGAGTGRSRRGDRDRRRAPRRALSPEPGRG